MTENCSICTRVQQIQDGHSQGVVYEFANSYLVVGDHQLFPGYCVLLAKKHYKELHDIPAPESQAIYNELMRATRAISASYQPWKINHASYGNVAPHVHWHIFPRYESDARRLEPVWLRSDEFTHHKTSASLTKEVASRVRPHLRD